MDLALLVYGISLIGSIGGFLGMICLFAFILSIFSLLSYLVLCDDTYLKKYNEDWKTTLNNRLNFAKKFAVTALVSGVIMVFLPSEKTAYLMVGAYAAQKVAESPEVEKLQHKVLQAIEVKLDDYIKESTESPKN